MLRVQYSPTRPPAPTKAHGCEQLAQSCHSTMRRPGVEPATSRSQRPTTTLPSHQIEGVAIMGEVDSNDEEWRFYRREEQDRLLETSWRDHFHQLANSRPLWRRCLPTATRPLAADHLHRHRNPSLIIINIVKAADWHQLMVIMIIYLLSTSAHYACTL